MDKLLEWSNSLGVHGPEILRVLKENKISWDDLPKLNDTYLERLLGVSGPYFAAKEGLAAIKGTFIKPIIYPPYSLLSM